MRLSHYFLPLLKETPSEAHVISHQLMLRTGMICQDSMGIYSWLPFGLRVLKKVEQIIREEQNRIGGQEILMPTLQSAVLWHETGRYEAYGKEMLRVKDRHDRELIYAPTSEDVVTDIFRRHVKSYKQLPLCLYQIHWKFRDEIRPRFGVMRCREFLMKDAYSFDRDVEAAKVTYFNMLKAYLRTFARMGVKVVPAQAESGAIGGDLSHELLIVAETGETTIYYDAAFERIEIEKLHDVDELLSIYAKTDEVHDATTCPVKQENLKMARGIEVGHIFHIGKKYTDALKGQVTGEDGQSFSPEMGCYGIGVGRIVAGIIEANHDDKGIKWPLPVAPFHIGLVNLKVDDADTAQYAEDVYQHLQKMGYEVLYDDRGAESPGAKFASMDLIGLPWHVVIGPRGLKEHTVEIKNRHTGEKQTISCDALYTFITEHVKIEG